eukprot:512725_1
MATANPLTLNTEFAPTTSPTLWTLSGMTAEEITIREKIFIGTHWIISILIFSIIPIVYFMHKYTQTKHQKPNNNNEHTVSQQTSELPTTNTTTTINKTNHSPNPTDYDTETQYEENDNSTVVSQNLNSHTQVTEQKNEKEIKSKSMNTFHSIRKYTMSPQSKKINKTFKILAVICIFMWWTRTVTAACSL